MPGRFSDPNATWNVYRHISPSGKVYIGITHFDDPKLRWGSNGTYYSKRTVFYSAIEKYGWDNIRHEVLFTGLSEDHAKQLEIDLIRHYKNLGISYNMTIGGEGYNFGKESYTAEYRTESSRKFREEHPDYDREQYEKFKDKKKEAARLYYWSHREQVLAQKRQPSYKEKSRVRAAKWRAEHPEYMSNYMKEYNAKRKAEKLEASNTSGEINNNVKQVEE